MKIIFPNENNGISVIHPTKEIPIEEVAKKDVPKGIPYLFVDDEDIPTDRTYREAWQADFTNPDGFGIGADAWLALQNGGN